MITTLAMFAIHLDGGKGILQLTGYWGAIFTYEGNKSYGIIAP